MSTPVRFLAAASVLLAGNGANAIITKEDPQQAVIDLADAKFFVSLFRRGDCAGSILSDSFVATAAHCVCGTRNSGVEVIDYQNVQRGAVAAYQNPGRKFNCNRDGPNANDVAVLEFAGTPFRNHDARPVYAAEDEVGQTMWILGMGIKGQPDDFATPKACRDGPTDSSLREGFNTVDKARDGILSYDMTQTGPSSHPREAIAQDGDSGGPALLRSDGEWMVAGVNSGTNENNSCDWGSRDEYCRLSEHAAWIDRAMDGRLDDAARGLWYSWDVRPPTTRPTPRRRTRKPTHKPAPKPPTKPPTNKPTKKPVNKPPSDDDDDYGYDDDYYYGDDDDCKDDSGFAFGKPWKDCDWVGGRPNKQKKKLCTIRKWLGKLISEYCPDACGKCK